MYAKQALWEAVGWLATTPDSIQKRLENAVAFSLSKIAHQNDGGLPQRHHEEFRSILSELSGAPDSGEEGGLAATARKLTDEECKILAERILNIYVDITGGL